MTEHPTFPVQVQRARLPGGPELHVERSGQGDRALVVLHGGPGVSCAYLEPLHALARPGRTVVLYDQAGGGRSTDPRPLEHATIGYLVDDLVELLDHLGLDRVDLLGHSFGTMLALQFALDHPARVRSLVLASGGPSARLAAGRLVAGLLADQGPEAVATALSAEVRGDREDPAYWAIVGAFFEHGSYPTREQLADREAAARWRAELAAIGPMGHALWGPWQFTVTGSLRDWDVRPRLREIEVPALVTAGHGDYATPSDAVAMAEALPRGAYFTCGSGHEGFLHGTALPLFTALVDAFLDHGRAAPPAS